MKNLKTIICDYPDFPKKGIIFKDLLPILRTPNIFNQLINNMVISKISKDADAILGIDARGFIFGSAMAFASSKPMIVARKPGKLPGNLIEKTYSLEYGSNSLSIQKESLKDFRKILIVDDLLATGGTISCVIDILESLEKEITGISVVAELKDLDARSKIDHCIESQIIF